MNIFMSTSSCCIFNWTIHWWNLMRWSEGLSSLLYLNRGRQSPQISIIGTSFGKPGTTEKLKGANIRARMASMVFGIFEPVEFSRWMIAVICICLLLVLLQAIDLFVVVLPGEDIFALPSPATTPKDVRPKVCTICLAQSLGTSNWMNLDFK